MEDFKLRIQNHLTFKVPVLLLNAVNVLFDVVSASHCLFVLDINAMPLSQPRFPS